MSISLSECFIIFYKYTHRILFCKSLDKNHESRDVLDASKKDNDHSSRDVLGVLKKRDSRIKEIKRISDQFSSEEEINKFLG